MLAIKTLIGASFVFAAASLGVAACSDDHPESHDDGNGGGHLDFCDLPTACQEIIVACHPKDLGEEGEIGDCHEVAHDVGTQAGCEAVHDDCVQLCNDTPLPAGGAPYEPECGDGGHTDHDHE